MKLQSRHSEKLKRHAEVSGRPPGESPESEMQGHDKVAARAKNLLQSPIFACDLRAQALKARDLQQLPPSPLFLKSRNLKDLEGCFQLFSSVFFVGCWQQLARSGVAQRCRRAVVRHASRLVVA